MPQPKASLDTVTIFDTTLRDGEQAPGCSMNSAEKVQVAQVLEEMNVDVIEAGFPMVSRGDFEAVSEISKLIKNSTISGMARAQEEDIRHAWEALKYAKKPRIHTYISTSPFHMYSKSQMDSDEVLVAIEKSVALASSLCPDVEWSAEDGTRSEPDFLCRSVETAITAGATTINIADSVGHSEPEEFYRLIEMLLNRVPNIDKAVISVHCHDDLGLATANALAGVKAGARQIECSVNGIGERAGNTSLEEVVMALRTRNDVMPYRTVVDPTKLMKISRLISAITGFNVHPSKAIVGANAFSHGAGTHQDAVLMDQHTYQIMTPESVGRQHSSLVVGKHSGRMAFESKVKELGFVLESDQQIVAFERFKDLADVKKKLEDEDIIAIINDVVRSNEYIGFVSMKVECSSDGRYQADIELMIGGEKKCEKANGNGPVDSVFASIQKLYPTSASVESYQAHSVTGGIDAQVEVVVRLRQDGRLLSGLSVDHDTLVASARAYINALNKIRVQEICELQGQDRLDGRSRVHEGDVDRKLAAILATDAVGYSRLIGQNDMATVKTLNSHLDVINKQIKIFQGRAFSGAGDSVLAEFNSAVQAVRCALDIQKELKVCNAALSEAHRMRFRIGIDIGEVVVEGEKLHGDGVNIAVRLEGLAEPGGICISGDTFKKVENKLNFEYEEIGLKKLKNITERIMVYRVSKALE